MRKALVRLPLLTQRECAWRGDPADEPARRLQRTTVHRDHRRRPDEASSGRSKVSTWCTTELIEPLAACYRKRIVRVKDADDGFQRNAA